MLGVLNIGPIELLLVLGAAVLLFGGDLPDTARKLGRLMAKARSAANDLTRTVYEAERDAKAQLSAPPPSLLPDAEPEPEPGSDGDGDEDTPADPPPPDR